MKKFLFIFFSFIISCFNVHAFEDCIITTKGKLFDIRIENNQIIDVFPLITIMNEKNTLIVHPLKEGITCFTVMKDMKEKVFFQVNVTEKTTTINGPQDFEIYVIDQPPSKESFELDEPPKLKKEGGVVRG